MAPYNEAIMSPILTNWRTSMLGTAGMMAALADIMIMLASSSFDGTRLGTDLGVLIVGVMGLFAKDAHYR
jgi:hypothetical protein